MAGNRVTRKTSDVLSWLRWRKVMPHVHGDVLDIGCGDGRVLEHLPSSVSYTGVDLNHVRIERAKKKYPKHDFFHLDAAGGLGVIERGFDTVMLLAVIEHVEESEELLMQCRRLTGNGGTFIITTPTPFGERVHGLLESVSIATPGVRGGEHVKIYSFDELEDAVERFGFKVRRHRRFQFGGNQLLVASAGKDAP